MNIESGKGNKRFKIVPIAYENYALKWMADRMHIIEVAEILLERDKKWGTTAYSQIARGLRQAYRKGRIKIIH